MIVRASHRDSVTLSRYADAVAVAAILFMEGAFRQRWAPHESGGGRPFRVVIKASRRFKEAFGRCVRSACCGPGGPNPQPPGRARFSPFSERRRPRAARAFS